MAKYKPYPKEYKVRMLKFKNERIEACKRNVFTFLTYAEVAEDKELKSRAFCCAMREQNLLKYLCSAL